MKRLLAALARLSAGANPLSPEQTDWLRRELAACGLPAQGHTPAGDTWSLIMEGDGDERASARITIPASGCGSVLLSRGWRHVDATESQDGELHTAPTTTRTTNGGRAAAQALLARLPRKDAA